MEQASNQAVLTASLLEQVEEYKVEKCLEGLAPKVGTPWVLKAHGSFSSSGLKVVQDTARLCIVCTDGGSESGGFWKLWSSGSVNDLLPVCAHCYTIMESNSLCKGGTVEPTSQPNFTREGRKCEACASSSARVISAQDPSESSKADHRLQPCRCLVCRKCAEKVAWSERSACPLCDMRVQWLADERALIATGWRVTRASAGNRTEKCGMCGSRYK